MVLDQNTLPDNNEITSTIDGGRFDWDTWETALPESVQRDIAAYVQGEKDGVSYMDCLWGELYGSINAHFWAGGMTEEQANYLRKKYLFGDEEDDGPDIGMNQLQNPK